MSFLINGLLFVITIIVLFYFYCQYVYGYWARRNIPYLKPKFPKGNLNSLLPRGISIGSQSKNYYKDLRKQNLKYGGIFSIIQPVLVVTDLEIIKDILIKDFQYFVDRGIYHNEKTDPLSVNLFSQEGHRWKSLRSKLTPTFTSGKMKMMFPTVKDCAQNMIDYIDKQPLNEVYMKDVSQSYTVNVIGNCAFGINCNCFKNPNSEFAEMASKVFEVGFWLATNLCFAIHLPNLGKKLGAYTIRKDVTEFYQRIVKENVEYRENNNITRPDLFQSLIELKNKENLDERIDMVELASQSSLFFIAGYETSSSTITYTCYNLALNPEIQERLREEINTVLEKSNGEITFENLNEMKYLDQVLDETLRMFSPVSTLTRTCTQDYTLKDGGHKIEKGTPIIISSVGIHYDPKIWPNPKKFDPERFNDENRKTIHSCAHLPFGNGPRNCIGLRFGLMQTKIGLIKLLTNYRISLNAKTKLPLEFDPETFVLFTKNQIIFKFDKL